MVAFLFLIYIALGAGAGWALLAIAGQSLPISIGGGAIITLVLGQLHLLMSRPKKQIAEIEKKVKDIDASSTDVKQRIKVVEALSLIHISSPRDRG